MGTQLPGLHTASPDAPPPAPSHYTLVGTERHSALCTQIIKSSPTCYQKLSFGVHVCTNQCQISFCTRARTCGQLNHSLAPPYAGSCKASGPMAHLLAQHLPLLHASSLPTAPSTVRPLQAEGTGRSEHQCQEDGHIHAPWHHHACPSALLGAHRQISPNLCKEKE